MHLIVRLSGLGLVDVAMISTHLKEAPRKIGADLGELEHTSLMILEKQHYCC